MCLIIDYPSLRIPPNIACGRMYTAVDLTMGIVEELYPGSSGEDVSKALSLVAKFYISRCSVITEIIYAYGVGGIVRTRLKEVKPGVVKVYDQ
jgi:hypothetical protein